MDPMGRHIRSGHRRFLSKSQQKRPAPVEPTFLQPYMQDSLQRYPAGSPRTDDYIELHMHMEHRVDGVWSGMLLERVSVRSDLIISRTYYITTYSCASHGEGSTAMCPGQR